MTTPAEEPQNPLDDPGALPDEAAFADVNVLETDRELVDLLAGRGGYVVPDTPDNSDRSVYYVTQEGVVWDHATHNGMVVETIATRPFLVKCELLNDHGDYSYTVVWLSSRGTVREMTLPAAVASDSRKLAASFSEFVVTSGNSGKCVEYVSRCLQANHDWLVAYGETVATAFGWPLDGTPYFISGPDRPHKMQDTKNAGRWFTSHKTRGELDTWTGFVKTIEDRKPLQVALAAALAPALLRVTGAANFVVDICGESTTGKTRALMLAASAWGEPTTNGVMLQCDTTLTAVEERMSLMRGMPVFMDDTQLAGKDDMPKLAYMVSQGRSRDRGAKDGGLRMSSNFETVLTVTGEQAIASMSEKSGTLARLVEVTGAPCADREQADKLTEVVSRNHGLAGPAFVDFLRERYLEMGNEVALTLRLTDRRKGLAVQAQSRLSARRAESVALLALTNELAHEAGLAPLVSDDVWVWLTNGADAISAEEEDKPRKALTAALSWAMMNTHRFVGHSNCVGDFAPGSGHLGRWDVEFVSFDPASLRKKLEELGYDSPAGLIRTWNERGWTRTNRGRNDLKVRMVPGPKGSVPQIAITMLEDLRGEEGDPDEVEETRMSTTQQQEWLARATAPS